MRGLEVDPALILHGEQALTVHADLPAEASVVHRGKVAHLYDKGSAAVLEVDIETAERNTGRLLATNRFGLFLRGAGGFGGDPGRGVKRQVPERAPDVEAVIETLPQQALIYRLCGDRNPLHTDPEYAARGGFPRPILHGLCTYGMTLRAVVDRLLDGDASAVAGFTARFAGVVYPGESLNVRMWREAEKIVLQVDDVERATQVLTHAFVTTR
jgi:acyl dehydratase